MPTQEQLLVRRTARKWFNFFMKKAEGQIVVVTYSKNEFSIRIKGPEDVKISRTK